MRGQGYVDGLGQAELPWNDEASAFNIEVADQAFNCLACDYCIGHDAMARHSTRGSSFLGSHVHASHREISAGLRVTEIRRR